MGCVSLILRCSYQFFGAMVVVGLVLICTAVTMTQKPAWMEEGQVGENLVSFFAITLSFHKWLCCLFVGFTTAP